LITSIDNCSTEKIRIFPNPAKYFIEIGVAGADNSTYQIIDMQGRIVKQGKLDNGFALVDISSLAKGIYSIVCRNSKTIFRGNLIRE
jgi:triacylglycerol esterase/lipase EstA (alpha/beta hydrolase family)